MVNNHQELIAAAGMTEQELQQLTADRPNNDTELFDWNAFYGYNRAMKRFAGLAADHPSKYVLEHGAGLAGKRIGDHERDSTLPAMISISSSRFETLRSLTNKALFSVGNYLYYADHALSEAEITAERQRLGRNLLVFPSHSTHHVDAEYSVADLCDYLEQIGRDFSAVRICLYWKDVRRGLHKHFAARGFECLTAGHMFDPQFVGRLKSLLATADCTLANNVGSSLAFSLAMERPHCIYLQDLEFRAHSRDEEQKHRNFGDPGWRRTDYFRQVQELFCTDPNGTISTAQQAFGERYCGVGEQKSAAELREIFDLTEDMYRRGGHYARKSKKIMALHCVELLNEHRDAEAGILLREAGKVYPSDSGFIYAAAFCLARRGRKAEALEIIRPHAAAGQASLRLLQNELEAA